MSIGKDVEQKTPIHCMRGNITRHEHKIDLQIITFFIISPLETNNPNSSMCIQQTIIQHQNQSKLWLPRKWTNLISVSQSSRSETRSVRHTFPVMWRTRTCGTSFTLAGLGIDWEAVQGHLLPWWTVNTIDGWKSDLPAQVQQQQPVMLQIPPARCGFKLQDYSLAICMKQAQEKAADMQISITDRPEIQLVKNYTKGWRCTLQKRTDRWTGSVGKGDTPRKCTLK